MGKNRMPFDEGNLNLEENRPPKEEIPEGIEIPLPEELGKYGMTSTMSEDVRKLMAENNVPVYCLIGLAMPEGKSEEMKLIGAVSWPRIDALSLSEHMAKAFIEWSMKNASHMFSVVDGVPITKNMPKNLEDN